MQKIYYTYTDEAPMLATHSFLPIVKAFAKTSGIEIVVKDISLAGRIIAAFNNLLPESQRVTDALQELSALAKQPGANIIKLPNISASVPQLKAAIAELREQGVMLPEYPDEPQTEAEADIRARYDSVKGSAVNPVLREGNSDRRAPQAVKEYAQKHPHSMGEWSAQSQTSVATMSAGDFFHNEKSVTFANANTLTIKHTAKDGTETVLKTGLEVVPGEILDATFMSVSALDDFLQENITRAQDARVLFSVHLKATMMKVSDPIIFGHVVRAYFRETFEKYGAELAAAGLNGENGYGALLDGLAELQNGAEIKAAFTTEAEKRCALAMVNSNRGITNLHVPSDVIVDASMPAMIRGGGKMWNAQGSEQDTLAVIPDSSYAGIYSTVIADCKQHGAYDPRTIGSVPNVGLMAKKAEEYGSHDKTFRMPSCGVVEVINKRGEVVLAHEVSRGDIWRACQTKDASVCDWVKLAVARARATSTPAIFWLDENRAHDAEIIKKVREYLAEHNTDGLDIQILDPASATQVSVTRMRQGKDTISVTGNVLRDYNTDLFPIIELGTSAKMLSVVPLLAGGGLYETGAGGSAPKHVAQLTAENHLRWDSLGEFMALAESLRYAGADVLAGALERATARFLNENKSPSRKTGELDNRGSHFWLARFWAEELAAQRECEKTAAHFAPIAAELVAQTEAIVRELIAPQGNPAQLGGYYRVNKQLTDDVMRPSITFNKIVASV
ncbi:NADP-dependent isocitrate dehydrogenase [Canibacter sp. lx-72]|uniref:NADP-dependent isocitrate dehydrogenase n=1 Tax=Canibacter zhuwentaonis TaxID=2837491 RepID=UPI001BDC2CDF|nr:NADP-dependent isocitrate dehydrogenase [Canibacter zhuwentaonis]MBT1018450.1 NADP-dependent isocitrate dehydrogenase [Canibacter zhuwentaonis]